MSIQSHQLRIAYKDPCRAATTADIADLAAGAPDPLDGVSLAVNDRVLVKNQSSGEENGIYRVVTVGSGANGAWERARDWNGDTENSVRAGSAVYIQEGTASTKKTFVLTTTGTIDVGTTSLAFTDNGTSGTSALGTVTTQNSGNINSQSDVGANTRMFILNRNGAAIKTLNLPLAASVTTPYLTVKHVWTSSSGICQVDANGAETIGGVAGNVDIPIGATLLLCSDGVSDWKIIKGMVDDRDLVQVPAAPAQTIVVRGWAPYDGYIIGAKVRVSTQVTVGAYALTLTNEDTGNTLLNAATFAMTGVSADTVTALTLSNTYSDRFLSEGGQWTASFASDDLGFNGDGIYIEIQYAASGV